MIDTLNVTGLYNIFFIDSSGAINNALFAG
ncbi:hypothetical protein NIASO_02195 [Niabella soli DSM 19437]|uniref:Uncharacterized protein n=1 Tax=Niabella soli DSM 19437 TaxID=929713 RepID=W0F6X6_9BACT|nr:hypothetical protein NIASO_02195 [Niabella soli DSM 19437]